MREVVRNTKKKEKRKNGLKIIAAAVLVLFVVITYSGIQLQEEKRALEKQKSELEEQLQTEQERSAELEDQRAYMQTVRYIEEVAREVLGLVYPEETILRPEEEE
ncbi:MAG: septum formation initiator family protein [Lachnospiraceae bacterium]|nr:septum formation initiator family protein [Lachnospiraceae bacterium]